MVLPVLNTKQSDLHLTLCLTHDCNLRCSYCYAGRKEARAMSEEVGRGAVELALARVSQRLHLVFFGGEPLLCWKELVTFTRYAREKAGQVGVEVRPTVTTNGTLLDDDRVSWLAAEGFLVAISCDGTRIAHDKNRRGASGASSYEATTKSIQRCLSAGLRVKVILVLDPATIELLPDSIASLVAMGVREIVTNVNWAADWSGDSVQAHCQLAVEKTGELYVQAYRQRRPFWLSLLDGKIASHIKGGYLSGDLCDLGQRNLVVAASGRLYPCDRLVGDDHDESRAVGDIRTGPLPQRIRQVVSEVTAPADCANCALTTRCRNRCACANLAMTGNLGTPSETLCFHEQLAIRTADHAADILFAENNPQFLAQHYYEKSTG
jgi:uncharacterized protein